MRPEVVAHDLHPEYLSTKYALEQRRSSSRSGSSTTTPTWRPASPSTGVDGPAIGAIFDGTGYGTDGTVWGESCCSATCADFRRVGTLLPVRLPGGERAIREPWRMACAWLDASGGPAGDPPRASQGTSTAARVAAGLPAWSNAAWRRR